ncbi:hypothetical protein [Qipengyuania sp. ASV99]|uniref:hypothetical protein n=1 Tax=Qipengyuania sp. ASV99 TaxID=3399681 RepID=UPI003A4C6312
MATIAAMLASADLPSLVPKKAALYIVGVSVKHLEVVTSGFAISVPNLESGEIPGVLRPD